MRSKIIICSKDELRPQLTDIIASKFYLDEKLVPGQIERSLEKLIKKFNKDLSFLIEAPYVDKLYRDSYYMYYSSKYGRYERDSIKVSVFKNVGLLANDFRNIESENKVKEAYLGFFVVRPTDPDFLGRNVISPKAFTTEHFLYCSCIIDTTANGIKLQVEGFPHSSQDAETCSCAETTIWSLMEYFGTKYPEYHPVKPSQIQGLLRKFTYERQIPSRGLTIFQISYVLKEMGFGCRIYSQKEYNNEFFRLLSCYIESGIPIAVGMDDFDESDSNSIGHAVLFIGKRKPKVSDKLTFLPNKGFTENQLEVLTKKQIEIWDLDDLPNEYVVIDDNQAPYELVPFENPVINYNNVLWNNVRIKNFVVPLYPKIYLEAAEAKNFIREFLTFGPYPLEIMQKVYLRFYLSSSRSFKYKLAFNNMESKLKNFILEMPMPKFVWIAELSSQDSYKKGKINGLIILDATEPNTSDNKPLIVAAYQNNLIFFDDESSVLMKISLTLHPFDLFLNNLTPAQDENPIQYKS